MANRSTSDWIDEEPPESIRNEMQKFLIPIIGPLSYIQINVNPLA